MRELMWPRRLATVPLLLFGAALVVSQPANAAGGRYDGEWAGAPALGGGSNPNCPAWRQMRLTIANDRFDQEVGRTAMQAAIGPDGSFIASGSYPLQGQGMERAEFAGRAAGNLMKAVYRTKFCTYNMTLHRQ